MSDLQELITQYKLSKTGDKNAVRCILSNMGDGKFLKSNLSFVLMCLLQLAEQYDESAYKTLYTLKQVDSENEPLYFEPDYIKEEKKIVEEARILAEAKAWKENMLAKKAAEERARLEAEEKARQAELRRIEEERAAEERARLAELRRIEEEKAAEERARIAAIEEERKAEELRQKEEEARKRKEEEERRKAEEQEAKRLAKIEAEEKERQLREQKELELVEHLKATATKTISNIVRDMVFIEGGNALLGSVNNSSNPPHMEYVESFWIKKHSIDRDEMEKLFIDNSVSSENIDKFVQRLSKILDCVFDIPTATQLEYAMRAKDKNYVPSNNSIRQIGDDRIIDYQTSPEYTKGYTILKVEKISGPIISLDQVTSAKKFRIVCSDKKLHSIKEEFEKVEAELRKKAEEEKILAERKRKEAEEEQRRMIEEQKRQKEEVRINEIRQLWQSVVNNFVNDIDTFEYEEGFFFNKKKKQIRFIKSPITWRVWNAIMLKDSLLEWEKQDSQVMREFNQKDRDKKIPDPNMRMPYYRLDSFLDKFNEYMGGKIVYGYLRGKKTLEEKLRDANKIRWDEHLYIEED